MPNNIKPIVPVKAPKEKELSAFEQASLEINLQRSPQTAENILGDSGKSSDLSFDEIQSFRDYNNGVVDTDRGINEIARARNQGVGEQAMRAVGKGITKGGLTFMANVGYIGDVGDWFSKFDKLDGEYGNWLSNLAESGKHELDKNFEIYRTNPDKVWDLKDSGFLLQQVEGLIDSTVGYGLTGAGIGLAAAPVAGLIGRGLFQAGNSIKVAGSAAELATLGRSQKAVEATKVFMQRALTNPEIAPVIQKMGTALASNYVEGKSMSIELYNNIYNAGVEKGIDKDKAHLEAAEQAKNFERAFKSNVVQEFFALNSIFKGVSTYTKGAEKTTAAMKAWEITKGMMGEAYEEVSGGAMQRSYEEVGKENLGATDKTNKSFKERLWNNATTEEALLEGVLGAIGGPFQQGTHALLHKAVDKATGRKAVTEDQRIDFLSEPYRKKLDDSISQSIEFEKLKTEAIKKGDEKTFKEIEEKEFSTLLTRSFVAKTSGVVEDYLTEKIESKESTPEEKELATRHKETLLKEREAYDGTYRKYGAVVGTLGVAGIYQAGNNVRTLEKALDTTSAEVLTHKNTLNKKLEQTGTANLFTTELVKSSELEAELDEVTNALSKIKGFSANDIQFSYLSKKKANLEAGIKLINDIIEGSPKLDEEFNKLTGVDNTPESKIKDAQELVKNLEAYRELTKAKKEEVNIGLKLVQANATKEAMVSEASLNNYKPKYEKTVSNYLKTANTIAEVDYTEGHIKYMELGLDETAKLLKLTEAKRQEIQTKEAGKAKKKEKKADAPTGNPVVNEAKVGDTISFKANNKVHTGTIVGIITKPRLRYNVESNGSDFIVNPQDIVSGQPNNPNNGIVNSVETTSFVLPSFIKDKISIATTEELNQILTVSYSKQQMDTMKPLIEARMKEITTHNKELKKALALVEDYIQLVKELKVVEKLSSHRDNNKKKAKVREKVRKVTDKLNELISKDIIKKELLDATSLEEIEIYLEIAKEEDKTSRKREYERIKFDYEYEKLLEEEEKRKAKEEKEKEDDIKEEALANQKEYTKNYMLAVGKYLAISKEFKKELEKADEDIDKQKLTKQHNTIQEYGDTLDQLIVTGFVKQELLSKRDVKSVEDLNNLVDYFNEQVERIEELLTSKEEQFEKDPEIVKFIEGLGPVKELLDYWNSLSEEERLPYKEDFTTSKNRIKLEEESKVEEIIMNPTSGFTYQGITVNNDLTLNQQQQQALEELIDHIQDTNPKNIGATLNGYAGTGKTTIIGVLHKYLEEKARQQGGSNLITYVTPTHQSSLPLGLFLAQNGISDFPNVINALINENYKNKRQYNPTPVLKNILKSRAINNVIIIDEMSMVNTKVFNALLDLIREINNGDSGIKFIFMGDRIQIPEVDVNNPKTKEINPAFNETLFKQVRLTHVMRTSKPTLLRANNSFRKLKSGIPMLDSVKDEYEFLSSRNFLSKALEKFKEDLTDTFVVTFANKDVNKLNQEIKLVLSGTNNLSVGDRIIGHKGSGTKTIKSGNAANTVNYIITSITYQADGKVVLNLFSDKIQELRDLGVALPSTITTHYLPLSDDDLFTLDGYDKNNYAKNKEFILKILGDIEEMRQRAIKNNKWRNYFDTIKIIGNSLADYNLGNHYAYDPRTKSLVLASSLTKEDKKFIDSKVTGLLSLGLDYGYAGTVHKSQGSTYKNIFYAPGGTEHITTKLISNGQHLLNERDSLHYVAISRASEAVYIENPSTKIQLSKDKVPVVRKTVKVTKEDKTEEKKPVVANANKNKQHLSDIPDNLSSEQEDDSFSNEEIKERKQGIMYLTDDYRAYVGDTNIGDTSIEGWISNTDIKKEGQPIKFTIFEDIVYPGKTNATELIKFIEGLTDNEFEDWLEDTQNQSIIRNLSVKINVIDSEGKSIKYLMDGHKSPAPVSGFVKDNVMYINLKKDVLRAKRKREVVTSTITGIGGGRHNKARTTTNALKELESKDVEIYIGGDGEIVSASGKTIPMSKAAKGRVYLASPKLVHPSGTMFTVLTKNRNINEVESRIVYNLISKIIGGTHFTDNYTYSEDGKTLVDNLTVMETLNHIIYMGSDVSQDYHFNIVTLKDNKKSFISFRNEKGEIEEMTFDKVEKNKARLVSLFATYPRTVKAKLTQDTSTKDFTLLGVDFKKGENLSKTFKELNVLQTKLRLVNNGVKSNAYVDYDSVNLKFTPSSESKPEKKLTSSIKKDEKKDTSDPNKSPITSPDDKDNAPASLIKESNNQEVDIPLSSFLTRFSGGEAKTTKEEENNTKTGTSDDMGDMFVEGDSKVGTNSIEEVPVNIPEGVTKQQKEEEENCNKSPGTIPSL